MDPLSITASIVGLITAAGKIARIVAGLNDADELTREIAVEVNDFRLVMARLQNFVRHSSTRDLPNASMVDLEQVVTILTSSVLTFSELEREIDRFKASPKSTTLKWAMSLSIKSNLRALLKQLQNQKSSLLMIFLILTCNLHSEAMGIVRQLQTTTEKLYATNLQMLQRLEGTSSGGLLSPDAASISGSVRTIRSMISLASFEVTLAQSRLYNRLLHKNQKASLDEHILRGWSVFSGVSLSEISNMAIYNLNITPRIVYNPEHYTKPIDPCHDIRFLFSRAGHKEMYNFIKLTIARLVVDGSLGDDTVPDGSIDIVALDCLYKMLNNAYRGSRLDNSVIDSLLATNFGDEVIGSFLKVSLYIACIEFWVDIVKLLLDERVDIQWEDSQGWTPLMIAVLAGGCIYWHGVDMYWATPPEYPDQVDIVRLLLDHQADIDASDKMGRTALVIATTLGNIGCIETLVERGASVGVKDATGRSVFHMWLSGKDAYYPWGDGRDISGIFISHGASIEARDNQGRTPLMIAAMNCPPTSMVVCGQEARNVLFHEASINLADQDGNTALHLLLIHNPPPGGDYLEHELLGELLSRGAKTYLKNNEGKTAVQLGIEHGIAFPASTPESL